MLKDFVRKTHKKEWENHLFCVTLKQLRSHIVTVPLHWLAVATIPRGQFVRN